MLFFFLIYCLHFELNIWRKIHGLEPAVPDIIGCVDLPLRAIKLSKRADAINCSFKAISYRKYYKTKNLIHNNISLRLKVYF